MHLNEAINDQWIQYDDLPTLLVQVIGHGQVISTGGFYHKPTMCPTGLHQLLKARFIITDFQVFDQLIHVLITGERGFTHIPADSG